MTCMHVNVLGQKCPHAVRYRAGQVVLCKRHARVIWGPGFRSRPDVFSTDRQNHMRLHPEEEKPGVEPSDPVFAPSKALTLEQVGILCAAIVQPGVCRELRSEAARAREQPAPQG